MGIVLVYSRVSAGECADYLFLQHGWWGGVQSSTLLSHFGFDLIDLFIEFGHKSLALLEYGLLVLHIFPCHIIHLLDSVPVELDLLLELADAGLQFPHTVTILVIHQSPQLFDLLSGTFYVTFDTLAILARHRDYLLGLDGIVLGSGRSLRRTMRSSGTFSMVGYIDLMFVIFLHFLFLYYTIILISKNTHNTHTIRTYPFTYQIYCLMIYYDVNNQIIGMKQDKISEILVPVKVSSQAMVCSNRIYLSTESAFPPTNSPGNTNFITFKGFILSYGLSPEIPRGKMGVSGKFREFLNLSLINQVYVQLYRRREVDQTAVSILFRVELLFPPKERTVIDDIKLMAKFVKEFDGFYVTTDQAFVYEYEKNMYVLTVEKVMGSESGSSYIGEKTNITCVASGEQHIRLVSAKEESKNIFSEGFTMDSLGIGGLDVELTNIFRRAFASRRLPLSIIDKFGIKHVKGILLYGPPGTGKTLIARQLAKSLKAKSLQIVNGPEVFSKYVGQSSQNVRKLFAPAREDEKKYGDESPLHILVFDQIDAITRQRGSDNSGTTAKDDVVNQLLTNLDGVEALNNIVVIGMTNRKDLIDEAILRPGRLEVHIEIGLPNEAGRKQIFQIHTKKLRSEGLLDKDVSIQQLARITKNYTGAEIEAVVKNASSYAMLKGNDVMDFSKAMKLQKNTKVTFFDFERAISEVLPGFGIDQEKFQILNRQPLINYGPRFAKIRDILERTSKLALNGQSQLASILLHGETGTGKTSIAAQFAKSSKFTYVKLITPEKFIGVGSTGKSNGINKVFDDAYKSKSSLIVIDNIERLIQFVQAGPDFNNHILQTLMTLIQKIPQNPQCRLLIIGTSSNYPAMNLIDIDKVFSLKLKIPLLNDRECRDVLGCDLGIKDEPIKKLIQFRETVQDQPTSIWKSKWSVYH